MASSHNQWVVQVPRIYSHLRQQGKVESFAHYLENIFKPLWSVSLHPSRNPRLFHFVNHISGFDSVEDESRPDAPLSSAMVPPHEWTSEEEPPYNYYMYYMWANIYSLNAFRRRRHFTSFTFRPSCGQCGSMDHLIGGLLLANSISYGVLLGEEDGPLQYLFYLARIGCTLSPLSNNSNVCGYLSNPFYRLFRRGLFVSLGTDSPLMYHHTQEPLIEEYSIASKIWKLTQNDMCEIARNSVLISGFSPAFKQEQLGERFFLSSSIGNDASCTHLSDVRVSYRFETYHSELGFLEFVSGLTFNRALYTLAEEEQWQQTLEARKAAQRDNKPLQDALIEANPDEADLERLQQQRTTLQQQMEEVNHTLNELRRQNKQLSEKLSEERARDAQAALLRRQRAEVTLSNFGDIQQHLQLQRLMNSQQLQSGVGTPNGEFLPAGTMTSHESKISFVSDGHSSKHGVGTPLHMATDSNHDSNNNNNNNNNSGEGAAAGSPDALLGYSEVLWNSNNTKPRKNKESSVTLPRL
ncbi:Adenosine/AMP deaminase, putative [Angomonas deanei]|uniref:Adenosine/AMP deaminase, putative n=1 Tax=Angomonas deanei TaxID=59799 RepID=A0A7G2CMN4_9TRYP|nr:Adenosine/AMP deaminase, putative [Angomonas deanei]